MIKSWTAQHSEVFHKEILTLEHDLAKTGLFTDEALADLLDKHPRSQLDVCTMIDHDVYQAKFRTGDVRDVDGKTLIEAARQGSIWMNLRQAMNLHEEYKKCLDQMYGDIACLSGRAQFKAKGGILITGPSAHTPFHYDATETILWHIRGHKQVHVYPRTEDFLPDEGYEEMLFSDTEDYLPYNSEMDRDAKTYDLAGNELITWPLNSPHRVANKTFCVSVTSEYSTRESTLKNSVMYTHAFMRRKMGLNPSWKTTSYPSKVAKAVAGRVLRKMDVFSEIKTEDMVTFTIDKSAPGYILDTAPYARNF